MNSNKKNGISEYWNHNAAYNLCKIIFLFIINHIFKIYTLYTFAYWVDPIKVLFNSFDQFANI